MDISNQIESLMRKNGVTRLKLSNDTGIPYTTLTQIINGRTKNPQVKALETIADYFNVSLDYILGNSTVALIESRLKEIGKDIQWLSTQTNISVHRLQKIDELQPIKPDYNDIDTIALALGIDSKVMRSALSRQEPPVYDGPQNARSLKEVFADVNLDETPDWATSRDKRDFKKMLEEDAPVMFDGVPISEEDKEKIKRVMEAMFWDAKKNNKETYGRKTKGD